MKAVSVDAGELTEELLVKLFGFNWYSFFGVPVKGTPGYPQKCRVRQLLSPAEFRSVRWEEFFAAHEGRIADGTEPLAYTYCSSQAPKPVRVKVVMEP